MPSDPDSFYDHIPFFSDRRSLINMCNLNILSNTILPIFAEIPCTILIYLAIGTIVLYYAWRTTFVNIEEIRSNPYRHRTVYIFNTRTGDFQPHSLNVLLNNNRSAGLDVHDTSPSLESIFDEMNGISYRQPTPAYDDANEYVSPTLEEQNQILSTMDRHLRASLNRFRGSSSTTSESQATTTAATTPNSDDTNVDSSPSTSNMPTISPESFGPSPTPTVDNVNANTSDADHSSNDEITIKLKYLNDSMRVVKAKPNEPIGDFKKRHFDDELSANKVVRLVFNGHVLQPDLKTVTACGLYDNCVVHCLIHNSRPSTASDPDHEPTREYFGMPNPNGSFRPRLPNVSEGDRGTARNATLELNQNRNRNTQRLLNLSLFLICLSVIISWFFRIQYFQLFSWYSTVGLVLLTMFFLIIIPLIFVIEREILRNI